MEKDHGCCCYFHPDEVFVGVCPLCLYERLIVVAAKRCRRGIRLYRRNSCKSSSPRIILPKIFAMDSLIHRKIKKHLLNLKDDASPTHDDSFISIRFDENNHVGAWEKRKDCNNNQKFVVEHAKPQWSLMRWQKRIGQLFQLVTSIKSKRQVASGRVALGSQWIRNLAKRKMTTD